jgi:undecaprenyl diphosphate synthase
MFGEVKGGCVTAQDLPGAGLGLSRMPSHVGMIMDGNGRWAVARGLPRLEGHRRGLEALRSTVRAAIEFKLVYLTVYSFSAENWSRPWDEIQDLMGLLKRFIRKDLIDLHRVGVRVKVIGDRDNLQSDIRTLLEEAEATTRLNTGLTLVVAFNYGGRQEIASAVREIARRHAKGEIALEAINEQLLAQHLGTAGIPDPDLIIRTSGEQRLSNFLLWQSAYSEFVFLPVLWPDFDRGAFLAALHEYAARERRFGGITAPRAVAGVGS